MPIPTLTQCKRSMLLPGAILLAFAGVSAAPASAATVPTKAVPKAHGAPGKTGVRVTPTVLAPSRSGAFGPLRQPAGYGISVTVYNGPGLCVRGQATIDHARPNTFSGNQAYSSAVANTQGCGAMLASPILQAASRLEVFKWNGSAWYVCRSTGWTYHNTGVIRSGDLTYQDGAFTYLDYGGKASCGAGYYGTMGYSYVASGGVWRGGSVWSGYDLVS